MRLAPLAPYVSKKQKIEQQIAEVEEKVAEQIRKRASEKIEKLEAEKASYQDIIDSMNATVKKMTGGYTTEDLVDCVKEGTGKMDDKGKEIMQTRYVLKYPETVIPENTETIVPPTTENVPGSDFDKDVEEHDGSDDPTDWEGEDEMPEELLQEQAETVEAASDADPFDL